MYYYGARYYDPRLSIFISVDPLAEQTFEPYSYTGNNPIMFTDPTGMSKEGGEDWFKNGDDIIWFDRSDSQFTDDNGKTWENVGTTLNDVKQNLNIPEDTTVKWNSVDYLAFGRGDGNRRGGLAPVAINNTAHVSFDFSVEGTKNIKGYGALVDGQSKITGLNVNVLMTSETNAPGTMLMNIGGNIGLRELTPLGNRNVVTSNPFSDLSYPMLSNSQWHASGQTKMNIGFNRLKNMTHNFTEKPKFTLGINSTVKFQYQLSAKKGFISTAKTFNFK